MRWDELVYNNIVLDSLFPLAKYRFAPFTSTPAD